MLLWLGMQHLRSLVLLLRTYKWYVFFFLIGIVVTAFFTFSILKFSSVFVAQNESESISEQEPLVTPTPSPPPDPLRPYTVLLLGYGGFGHDGGSLTDTMLLAYIVPRDQRATLFSIPRDLWVELPITEEEKKWGKINSAFAIGNDDRKYTQKPDAFSGPGGGGRMAKAVISEVIGIEVDYFAAIDFFGFTRALDSLGPLSVSVPVAFDDTFYPIAGKENETCDKSEEDITALTATMSGYKLEQEFTCRYEELHFDAGLQQMDSETILKFVRSRHSDQHGGDFGRSERQQALLVALKNKLLSPTGLLRIVPTVLQLTNYLQTDITTEKIREILTTHQGLSDYTFSTVRLTDSKEENVLQQGYSTDRQYILMPTSGQGDWTSVREFFQSEVIEQ